MELTVTTLTAAERDRLPQTDFAADIPSYPDLCRELDKVTAADAHRQRELLEDLKPALAALEEQERIKREGEEARITVQQHAWASSMRLADMRRSIEANLPLPLKNALRATASRQDEAGQAAHQALLELRYKNATTEQITAILNRLADESAAEQKRQAAAIINARPGLRT